MSAIASLIRLYTYVIIARVLLSWFPISRGGAMESIYNAIYTVTEPVLGPVRRTLPAFGGLDFSPIVVILALQLLSSALGGR
ncbi:MAG: YggT family protein [Actinomycetota bacterium]